MQLLDIKNLTLEIPTASGSIKALDKVSLSLKKGEISALVGESGSGKSLIVRTIVGAIPDRWNITADRLTWKGQDLLGMSEHKRRRIIRDEVSVVFQNAVTALDPTATLGEQLLEAVPDRLLPKTMFWQRRQHRLALAQKQLHKVGIKDHELCMKAYPHQVADDVCQKLMLAMSLVSQPELLIADDPTMGMEITTKVQILRLLTKLNQTRNLSILYVSHDLLAIATMATNMTVLYCGQTVESGSMSELRHSPLHPYTKALLDSAPSFRKDLPRKTPLSSLPGTIPTLQHLPIGCRLGPRCPRAGKECVKAPKTHRLHNHFYNCHFPLLPETK
ncbi:oligopeptide/dipeptide ABC transporter ATP-binding protein [Bowmanella sp. JS7-9]|uniref:Oligopeptide/dipeptide ABC transporter ATP-binding protein n=1 Tax=Pseudobowmanella zhangzhouensis TaxID=1537679 RepID=A0ABW1XJT8_9ALTE|nr:oligopeptide/dipeptide ABC transporter ATP-binding protein [Bowmanella sp. JS7-9]TBX25815.1 peptide ABC transporter ATP-binding protein [Bowmanella sp. JS7-9]